jgi:hypothetical protein
MMEEASISEMMANFYQTTPRYNPKDSYLINYVKFVWGKLGWVRFECEEV